MPKREQDAELMPWASQTIGEGDCPSCGGPITFTLNRNGFGSAWCPKEVDGGCDSQYMPKARKSTVWLFGYIRKWRKPEVKVILFGKPEAVTEKPEKKGGKPTETPEPELSKGSVTEPKKETRAERDARHKKELFG